MNHITIIGRLTREPEERMTNSGRAVTNFTVAVSRRVEGTDFIPVVTWNKLAGICAQYLHKGSQVMVAGALQTRSYENAEGQKRTVFEIVANDVEFLGSKNSPQEPISDTNDTQTINNTSDIAIELETGADDEFPWF